MGVAGTVDFPAHMKTIHQDWLDNTATDVLTTSMQLQLQTATTASANPYYGKVAYNPYEYIVSFLTYLWNFNAVVSAFIPTTYWSSTLTVTDLALSNVMLDDTYLDADIEAFADVIDDQITDVVLPRFQAGMSDVNAVMTSAFVMGEAHIEGMRNRDVAKYGTDLRQKMNIQKNDAVVKSTESLMQTELAKVELYKLLTHFGIEAHRIGIVAQKEYTDQTLKIAIGLRRWPFEAFMYAGNLLASIGGGTYIPNETSSPSGFQSAMGGALSGAAIGSAIGQAVGGYGGEGALIGGVIGLGGGL